MNPELPSKHPLAAISHLEPLLVRLLAATNKADVAEVYDELQRRGAQERAVGDREGNLSTIHVTADADATEVERVTNAIDGTFERLAMERPALAKLRSPREFVMDAYGLSAGTLTKLSKPQKERLADDAGIAVRIKHGDSPETPTIEVRDHGIGILPMQFPKSIMSLNENNKISKWYLMGRFGQGGSTTLRYCDYSVIVSRRIGQDLVGFTIARYRPPEGDAKGGTYVYLVGPDNEVLSVRANDVAFEPGTAVRQINYRFSRKMLFLDIYATFERQLFDTVLPFWLVEERTARKEDRRRILGSRDHLTRSDYVEAQDEFRVPIGSDPALGDLTIRYWVFKSVTETKTKSSFIDPSNPIVLTYLGQTHDQLPRRILNNDCKLPYLYKDLVVQVDLDDITDRARFAIFTSDRERITKEGRLMVESAIVGALKDDPDLRELEAQREQEFFSGKSGKETEDMQRRLAEMINRIKPGTFKLGPSDSRGRVRRRRTKGGGRGGRDPLPTRAFPTYLEIANKKPIDIILGSTARIELHSDAPDGFLEVDPQARTLELSPESARHARITVSHKDFHGGRLYVRIAPVEGQPAGTEFTLEFVMRANQPGGNPIELKASGPARLKEPEPKGDGDGQGLWAPEIVEVGPDIGGPGQKFYEESNWSEANVAEVKESTDAVRIFVSVANRWLLGAISTAKLTPTSRLRLRHKFALHVALHAYLQHDRFKSVGLEVDEAQLDKLREDELDRSARTLITALTSVGAFQEDSSE